MLGCDGANSTIRELTGIPMEDLGFTERWLVVDIRVEGSLDTWDGVEQICDPARAATFMQVTGDRYRWEFRLRDGEDEACLSTPEALGELLRPWTGRGDLAGMEITRSASYTFRARLPARFQAGRVFLLGDAAHLTRRSSARAWPPGCATPTTWPGNSPACSPTGPGRTCSPATTPNAARTPGPWPRRPSGSAGR